LRKNLYLAKYAQSANQLKQLGKWCPPPPLTSYY
jgi:hypothetical protein